MNPVYYIKIAEEDITARVQQRLVQLTLTDQAGMANDVVNITIDDRDQVVKIPPKGALMEVRMGYERKEGHTNPINLVRRMGYYTVSQVGAGRRSMGGPTMTITGKALYDENSIKTPRRKSYHRLKIKDIVQAVADRSGLKAKVHEAVRDLFVKHIDQELESDLQFLTNFATRIGCVMKIQDNEILFAPSAKLHEISRLITDSFTIDASEIEEFEWLSQTRGAFSSVQAKYKEQEIGQADTGNIITVSTGGVSGEADTTPYLLNREFASRDEALRAVAARKRQLDHALDTLNFKGIGHPSMVAEAKVNIRNFRKGIPDEWLVTKVTHIFDNAGAYKINVDCEQPKAYEEANAASN